MARVFTTSIEFNHQKYEVIISVMEQQNQLTFLIRFLDEDMHHLLPGGRVSYNGANGFEMPELQDNTVSQAIMRRIGDAIKKHLVIT